jgi:hypothetical protein
MKLQEYLSESIEDKLFGIIDKFEDKKNIMNPNVFMKFTNYVAELLDLKIDVIYSPDTTTIIGASSPGWIGIKVPADLKVHDALGTLFHEISHQYQFKKMDLTRYLTYAQPQPGSAFSFTNYVIQPDERPAQAISIAIALLMNKIDLSDMLKHLDNVVETAKGITDLQIKANEIADTINDDTLRTLIYTYALVKGMKYQSPDNLKNMKNDNVYKKFINQFKPFIKNIKKSYDRFKPYFKKYGLI